MALGADIVELQQKVLGELALKAEIVLGGVLRTEVRLEVAIHKNGAIVGPAWVLAFGCLGQETVETVGRHISGLTYKWRIEQRV
jgi:hypothetical protein